MMVAEVIAEGGGFPPREAAAVDHLQREIAAGGRLVNLGAGEAGWHFGVENAGMLIGRVRLQELEDGTWLVASSERCSNS